MSVVDQSPLAGQLDFGSVQIGLYLAEKALDLAGQLKSLATSLVGIDFLGNTRFHKAP
jgi:hypothetical protein